MIGSECADSSSGSNGAPTSASVRCTVGEEATLEDAAGGGEGGGAGGVGGAEGGVDEPSSVELEVEDTEEAEESGLGETHTPGMIPSSREEQTNGGAQSLGE